MRNNKLKDFETLQNLQYVIENLANGINVFTGEFAEETDIINDVKIARALFTTNEVLKELLEQQKPKRPKKHRKPMFVYNEELIKKVVIAPQPISLSEIARNIVAAYNNECKLTYNNIAEILCAEGILVENKSDTPKLRASDKAKDFGIWSEIVYHANGARLQTFYNSEGQVFVLGLLKKHF